MLRKLKTMLGMTYKSESHKPDPLRAQLIKARQHNETAATNLKDLLTSNDAHMKEVVKSIVGKM